MIVGGLRHRLLYDSLHDQVAQALNTLGWMDPARYHKPIRLLGAPTHWSTPVALNTIAVDFEGSDWFEAEIGSRLTSDTTIAYVDIYAQNDSLGLHLSNDLRDWLRGRLQATPTGVNFPILDYRDPTPSTVGYMDIHDVTALRNSALTLEIWMRHWYRVRCEITDTYATSEA